MHFKQIRYSDRRCYVSRQSERPSSRSSAALGIMWLASKAWHLGTEVTEGTEPGEWGGCHLSSGSKVWGALPIKVVIFA